MKRILKCACLRSVANCDEDNHRSRHGTRTLTVRKFLASITGVETPVKKKPSGWRAFPIFLEEPRHGHSQDAGVMMIPPLLRYFHRGNVVFFFSMKFSYAQCIEQFTGQERLC